MPGFSSFFLAKKAKACLLCPHCRLILRDAVQTEDGDRLCSDCLEEIRTRRWGVWLVRRHSLRVDNCYAMHCRIAIYTRNRLVAGSRAVTTYIATPVTLLCRPHGGRCTDCGISIPPESKVSFIPTLERVRAVFTLIQSNGYRKQCDRCLKGLKPLLWRL